MDYVSCSGCKRRRTIMQVVVKPSRVGDRQEVPVTCQDHFMGQLPIFASGFPAYCFGFTKCPDPKALIAGLAEALSTWRVFAGRFNADGTAIILGDEGVPFTVREAEAPISEEEAVSVCADWRAADRVMRGQEPPMTVMLFRVPSGGGILAICRSHGVADGATFMTFVTDWSAAVAGKPLEALQLDHSVYEYEGSSEEAIAWASESTGRPVGLKSAFTVAKMKAVMRLAVRFDLWRLALGGSVQRRPRLLLTDAELAAIKDRASKGLRSVPWITTQEALFAHLLLELPAFFETGPRVGLLAFLDGKRFLGEAGKRLVSGTCVISKDFVFDITGKSLSSFAEELHVAFEAFKGEAAKKELLMVHGYAKHMVDVPVGPPNLWRLKDCDYKLCLNNQSKFPLPDFGSGHATWANSSSGPSLLLPRRGGVTILFQTSSVPGCTGDRLPEALEARLRFGGARP